MLSRNAILLRYVQCEVNQNPSINTFNNKHHSLLIQTLAKKNKLVFLQGDINISLLKCDDSLYVSNILDILGSQLLIPQITLPTRIAQDSSLIIYLNFFCESSIYSKADDGKNISCSYPDWSNFKQEEFVKAFRNLNWDVLD